MAVQEIVISGVLDNCIQSTNRKLLATTMAVRPSKYLLKIPIVREIARHIYRRNLTHH